jgi:hypothetical protein
MSTFNVVVPPHPLGPYLLRIINWAQPDDPNKTYPLLGRIRYAWIDKNKNINLLLKDGPSSWSEEQEQIKKQIEEHETFVSVETLKRDPVYLVATFKPIMKTSYDRGFPPQEFLDNLDELDNVAQLKGWPALSIHPFELFDKAMEEMKAGKMNPRMEKFAQNLKNTFEQAAAEEELSKITNNAGVTGIETSTVKILKVDNSGDITEEGLK